MADPTIVHMDYYVYVLYREDGITPFYVGKGRGNRWLVHEREAARRTSRKDRIIQKMLTGGMVTIPKVKVAAGLTDDAAKQIEISMIRSIGRAPHGPLANHTDGGDGVNGLSEEARARKTAANLSSWADPAVRSKRIAGMKAAITPEFRAAHAAKLKIILNSPETREKRDKKNTEPTVKAKRIAASKAMWADPIKRERLVAGIRITWAAPSHREKMSAAQTGRKHTDETREKMRASQTAMWRRPEFREAVAAGMKNAQINPETTAKRRALMLHPDHRAKLDAGGSRPEIIEKRTATLRQTLATPEAKARRSAASKAMWAKRKATVSQ